MREIKGLTMFLSIILVGVTAFAMMGGGHGHMGSGTGMNSDTGMTTDQGHTGSGHGTGN